MAAPSTEGFNMDPKVPDPPSVDRESMLAQRRAVGWQELKLGVVKKSIIRQIWLPDEWLSQDDNEPETSTRHGKETRAQRGGPTAVHPKWAGGGMPQAGLAATSRAAGIQGGGEPVVQDRATAEAKDEEGEHSNSPGVGGKHSDGSPLAAGEAVWSGNHGPPETPEDLVLLDPVLPLRKLSAAFSECTNDEARAMEADRVDPSPMVTLDMRQMEALLQAQCRQIVASNEAQVQQLFATLENKYDKKLADAEVRFDNVEERVGGVEARLQKIEDLLRQGKGPGIDVSHDDEARRKLTLVFGGWQPDTPRRTIVAEVTEALEKLDLQDLTDSAPFTTGPRRSVALMGFKLRTGEGLGDTRRRMLKVITGLADSQPLTSHGKKMWCSYSRTKAERDVSGHASWVKRAINLLEQGLSSSLDIEFSTGTVWCGDSMVASATKAPPVVVQESDVMWDDRLVTNPWIHVAALARETRKDVAHLESTGGLETLTSGSVVCLQESKAPANQKILESGLNARRADRKQWEQARLAKASQCDWASFRRVRAEGQGSWPDCFAAAQATDPHEVVDDHFKAIYKADPQQRTVFPEGDVVGFSVEEIRKGIFQMKKGKSVGVDLTSRELFEGLLETPGGASHLAEFFTSILVSQQVPKDWNKSILIVLAKVPQPLAPRDLRPIALGSATSKLFARLLLNRCLPKLGPKSPYQCAREHRQSNDYVFSLWRIFELCREWNKPLTCVKIDIHKAFDSVDRGALIRKLRSRLGSTAEMACFEQLLLDTTALLVTPWGMSEFRMDSGIKQGAVESPCFFSLLMEEGLEEAAELHRWSEQPLLFPDLVYESALFMDDGILWGSSPSIVARKLEQFLGVLKGYGLHLNVQKCQLYCSKDTASPHSIRVQEHTLVAHESLEIMGLQLRKGMSMCELLQPLISRAKQKFWSLKHLLRCKTPIRGRVHLFQRVVAGTALWCISALPPDKASMGLLNSIQAMLLGWMMRLYRAEGETWIQFRQRVIRSARSLLHSSGCLRWSTLWLQRWWDYSGHRVRGLLHPQPPLSAYVDEFRSLSWWRHTQKLKSGPRHGHHYARLTALEEGMNRVCQGPWRGAVHDRGKWRSLRACWIDQNDLPWASGRQLALPDWS
ncbi:pol [Symbiodinium sp. CCMP2592]|nr:pol [Symbiodinium sp. CCMP2592]